MAQDLIFKMAPIFLKCNLQTISSSNYIFKGQELQSKFSNYTFSMFYLPVTIFATG
jgi:hypothetical protein